MSNYRKGCKNYIMAPRKKPAKGVTEEDIVSKFVEIAFAESTKDSDRLRALDWLSDYLNRTDDRNAVLDKLDEVLNIFDKQ